MKVSFWNGDGKQFTLPITTSETSLTPKLLKEMFEAETKTLLNTINVKTIEEYAVYIQKYSLRLDDVEISNEVM